MAQKVRLEGTRLMLVPLSSEAVAVAEVVMVEMRLATEVTLYSVQVLGEEDKEIIV